MASTFRQEMPPKGGYGPVQFLRQPGTRKLPGRYFMYASAVSTVLTGLFLKHRVFPANQLRRLELLENEICMEPMMTAEKDRLLLRQYWENREDENKLMKDVPGWITGTWYGQPVYYNKGDRFIPVNSADLWAHDHPKAFQKRHNETVFDYKY